MGISSTRFKTGGRFGEPKFDLAGCGLYLPLGRTDLGSTEKVLRFDGTDDVITLTTPISLNDNWTIEGWMRVNKSTPSSLCGDSNVAYGYLLIQDSSPKVVYEPSSTDGKGISIYHTIEGNIQNKWVHFAFVMETPTLTIYFEGQPINDGTPASAICDLSVAYLGRGYTGAANTYWGGHLKNVRIYSRSLGAAEVATNAARGWCGAPSSLTSLEGYWKLNEGTGTTVTDSSSNSNDGTISGAIWDVAPILVSHDSNAYKFVVSGTTTTKQGRTFTSGDYIFAEGTSTLNRTTDNFSFGAWANPTGTITANPYVCMSKGTWNSGLYFLEFMEDAPAGYGGKFVVRLRDTDSNQVRFLGDTDVKLNTGWHFYFVTIDRSGNAVSYFDGAATGLSSLSTLTGSLTNSYNFMVGIAGGFIYTYTGGIGDVFQFDWALSASEVTRLFQETQWRYK